MNSETLFYMGLAVMVVAVVLAIAAAIVLMVKKRRLDQQMDAEYGVRNR